MSALTLRPAGSHLYPGARGSLEGAVPSATAPCLVEFADGSAAIGSLCPAGDALLLETRPYVTARGTRIPAKRWRVAASGGAFRVLGRA